MNGSHKEKPKEQIIYLEPDDEIATIRDRIIWAEAPRVVLVVPHRNKAMRDKMNLRLVQRTGVDQAIQVALVAHHRDTVRLAKEIGLPVFWSANGLLGRHNWKGAAAPLFVPDDDGDEVKLIPPSESIVRKDYQLISALVFGIVMLLLGALILLFAPTAQITLTPVSEEVSVALEIIASPSAKNISAPLGQIPARVEELALDGSEQIAPIAKKDVPDARASGTIVFTNKTDQPLRIPKGTFISTSAGVPMRFQTTNDADVAPRGHTEVPISAVDPGPSGNVAKFTINTAEGPFALLVNVINQNATSGGTVKRVPVVSEEDKRRVEEILIQRLRREALSKYQAILQEGEFIAPESVSVRLDSKTYDKFVDEPADLLTLTAHATARGTIVDGSKANIVALRQLGSKLRPGFVLIPKTVEYIPGAVLSVEQDSVRFEIKAKGQATAGIDSTAIADNVRGMTIQQAEAWLNEQLRLRRDPVITIGPDWLKLGRMPFFDFRIHVEVVQ